MFFQGYSATVTTFALQYKDKFNKISKRNMYNWCWHIFREYEYSTAVLVFVLVHPYKEHVLTDLCCSSIGRHYSLLVPLMLFSSGLSHPGHRLLAREHSGHHGHYKEQESALTNVLFHLQVHCSCLCQFNRREKCMSESGMYVWISKVKATLVKTPPRGDVNKNRNWFSHPCNPHNQRCF